MRQAGHANARGLTMQFHEALCEAAHNSTLLQVVRHLHDSARLGHLLLDRLGMPSGRLSPGDDPRGDDLRYVSDMDRRRCPTRLVGGYVHSAGDRN